MLSANITLKDNERFCKLPSYLLDSMIRLEVLIVLINFVSFFRVNFTQKNKNKKYADLCVSSLSTPRDDEKCEKITIFFFINKRMRSKSIIKRILGIERVSGVE